jgi:hypothetical protein
MDSITEGQLIQSLSDAYASMYEAKYHIKQADDQISRLQSRGPMTKKEAGRAKAWQRLKDHESKIPENKDEQRAMAKERRKQPKKTPEEKLKAQKPGREAMRVRGMARNLKKNYGSANAAAKDPKVKKKVDGVYKDMLKSNTIEKDGKRDKEAGTSIQSRQDNDAKKSAERAPKLQQIRKDMKLKERVEAVMGRYTDPQNWLSNKYK